MWRTQQRWKHKWPGKKRATQDVFQLDKKKKDFAQRREALAYDREELAKKHLEDNSDKKETWERTSTARNGEVQKTKPKWIDHVIYYVAGSNAHEDVCRGKKW